jgi:1-acyl-sn-glycerol-3-phosphate acyltransferase
MQPSELPQRIYLWLCRRLVRLIFFFVCKTKVVYFARPPAAGGYILASNHISHFDPPILSSHFRHYIDWMTMEELFRNRLSALLMESLRAFRVRRDGSDRTGLRTALKRLEQGRVVGVFPEGGIRAGIGSVLEGAAMWPGASALSVLACRPILPVVILGSDRLYKKATWTRFRSVTIWIGFGDQILPRPDITKHSARELVQGSLAQAFVQVKERLVSEFNLADADLPSTPQARKREDYLAPG